MRTGLPTQQEIAQRACEIYLQSGCQAGFDRANWLTAEKELMEQVDSTNTPDSLSRDSRKSALAAHAFLNFFGLREQPFGATPDPTYLYASKTHGDALASLSRGISDDRGFMSLIAEPGMGKTTLLYQLIEALGDSARIMYIFQTQCDSREFLQYILRDLGVDAREMGLVEMHDKLNELLFEAMLAGKHSVLIVDEAQNLSDSVLETVRMFSNFETHRTKLLQIVLAGQPALASKLAQPQMAQLRQRIASFNHLEQFSSDDTAAYIHHRLAIAGYRGEGLFETDALHLIARRSDGIPRNINNISYNSLLASNERGRATVNAEAVEEALGRLDVNSVAPANSLHAPVASPAEPSALPIALPVAAVRDSTAVGSGGSVPGTPSPHSFESAPAFESSRWGRRSAAVTGVLLLGALLPIVFKTRNDSSARAASFAEVSSPKSLPSALDSAPNSNTAYDADPRDDYAGQILTVVARPQETLKDISLLYVGRYDANLRKEIVGLNPELKDVDELSAGQLVRMPLPAGTLKKVVDTAETESASKGKSSEGLLAKVTGFIHRSQ